MGYLAAINEMMDKSWVIVPTLIRGGYAMFNLKS